MYQRRRKNSEQEGEREESGRELRESRRRTFIRSYLGSTSSSLPPSPSSLSLSFFFLLFLYFFSSSFLLFLSFPFSLFLSSLFRVPFSFSLSSFNNNSSLNFYSLFSFFLPLLSPSFFFLSLYSSFFTCNNGSLTDYLSLLLFGFLWLGGERDFPSQEEEGGRKRKVNRMEEKMFLSKKVQKHVFRTRIFRSLSLLLILSLSIEEREKKRVKHPKPKFYRFNFS